MPKMLTAAVQAPTAYARMAEVLIPEDVRQMLAGGLSPVLVREMFEFDVDPYEAQELFLAALVRVYTPDFCERLDALVVAEGLSYKELWHALPASPLKCSYHYRYLAARFGYARLALETAWGAKEALRGLTVLLPLATWRVTGKRGDGSKRVGPDGLPCKEAWRVAGRAANVIEGLLAAG